MESSNCTALVPYQPKRIKSSYFSSLYKLRRSETVISFFCAFLFMFLGAVYETAFVAEGSISAIPQAIITSYDNLFAAVLFLATAFIFSFSIFSPAAAIILLIPLSARTGFRIAAFLSEYGFSLPYIAYASECALFAFFTSIYAAELLRRGELAGKGIRYILKKEYTVPIVIKSVIFCALYTADIYFNQHTEILKGLSQWLK